MITRRGLLKLAGQAWLTMLALGGYATGVEAMGRPRVTNYAITPPRWTPGLKLKVVILADFHACEPWMTPQRIAEIADQANALGGDIILLMGDFATSMKIVTSYLPPADIAAGLVRLKAALGVHAVLGNHDYWADPAFQEDPSLEPVVAQALRDAGIPVYINETIRLEKDGFPFWLAGLGDQIALRPSRAHNRSVFVGIEDMQATLAPVVDDAPVLLMAHEPYVFSVVPERINLTISGHTHGGQINIFGWAPFVQNRPDAEFLEGHIVREGKHLLVSRGLGCSGVPLRLGVWPEIVTLDLG